MVFSFIPFGVLMLITYTLEVKVNEKRLDCIFWGGFVSIFGPTLESHISMWYPLYSGGHFSSTSGLVFCILPVLCIGLMGIGMVIGWGISFLPIFKSGSIDN